MYQVSRTPGSTVLPTPCRQQTWQNCFSSWPPTVCDCGNREAISKPGVFCQAAIAYRFQAATICGVSSGGRYVSPLVNKAHAIRAIAGVRKVCRMFAVLPNDR